MEDFSVRLLHEWFDTYQTTGVKVQRRVTMQRLSFINEALLHYKFEDLVLLLQYLRISKDNYARFMRGENQNRKHYLKLSSIFRVHKLSDKIERAKEWKSTREDPIEAEDVYNPFSIMFGDDNELD